MNNRRRLSELNRLIKRKESELKMLKLQKIKVQSEIELEILFDGNEQDDCLIDDYLLHVLSSQGVLHAIR